MLNGHGDDGYQYQKEIIADFSTNVWYGGEPKGLKEFVFENWNQINRYPEVVGESLCKKIAAHHGILPGQVLVNNGTTESIYLIAQLFSGKKTTILTPSFSEYEDACSIFGHDLHFLPWTDALDTTRLNTEVVFICNPNNPTGKVFTDLEDRIKRNAHCLFVVDEAFIEFTFESESLISIVEKYHNLIIMRSLTKAYAIPGLRLGYIVAQQELIEDLTRIKQPWTVNTMALSAGEFIFDNFESAQFPLKQLLTDKLNFVKHLRTNEAIEVEESFTHFFLCKTMVRNAGQLKAFLISNYGILIRDAGNFRSLTRQHFRIATLHPDKNSLLLNALNEWKKLYY